MSNEPPPPPGPPPEDDPFSKRPRNPPPPGGSPYDGGPPPPPYDPGPYGGGGAYGGVDPLAGMPPLATPGRRILARLIDLLVITVPLYLISLPFGGWVDASSDNGNDDFATAIGNSYNGHQLVWSLIALVVYVAYDTYLTHKDGRTLGKRLLKMRVAMLKDGSVPDTGSALMRAAVLWVPALVCCPCLWWLIDIVVMYADKPYRQGLQDKAAKTVVVSAS